MPDMQRTDEARFNPATVRLEFKAVGRKQLRARFNPATVRLEFRSRTIMRDSSPVSTPQRFDWNKELVDATGLSMRSFNPATVRLESVKTMLSDLQNSVSTPQRFDWNLALNDVSTLETRFNPATVRLELSSIAGT